MRCIWLILRCLLLFLLNQCEPGRSSERISSLSLEKNLRVLAHFCIYGGWRKRESLSVDGFPGDHLNLPHSVADFFGICFKAIISCTRVLSPLEEATEIVHGRLGSHDITLCRLPQSFRTLTTHMVPEVDVVLKDVSGAVEA